LPFTVERCEFSWHGLVDGLVDVLVLGSIVTGVIAVIVVALLCRFDRRNG
jgi:multisubunit Na+/H+ antiporter MnhC subunit